MIRPATLMLSTALLVSASAGTLRAQGWLYQRPGGAGDALSAISFCDQTTGVIAGTVVGPGVPVLISTSDGGSTWRRTTPAFAEGFRTINVLSPLHWIASGTQSCYRTTDAGATWSSAAVPGMWVISGMRFIDSLNGVAVGRDFYGAPVVRRTGDGGVTWGGVGLFWTSRGYNLPVYSVAFASPTIGVAVGGGGAIWRTIDAGYNWSFLDISDTVHSGIAFNGSGTGIMTGATVMRSTDWGATWSVIPGLGSNFVEPAFGDDAHATLAGQTVLAQSSDGGATWTATSIDLFLNGVAYRGPSGIWSVSNGGAAICYLPAGATIPIPVPALPPDGAAALPMSGSADGSFGISVGWRYYPFTTFNVAHVPGDPERLSMNLADNPAFDSSYGFVLRTTPTGGFWQDTTAGAAHLWPSSTYYWNVEHHDPLNGSTTSALRTFTTRDSLPITLRAAGWVPDSFLTYCDFWQKMDPSRYYNQWAVPHGRPLYVRAVCAASPARCADGSQLDLLACDPSDSVWNGMFMRPAAKIDPWSRRVYDALLPGDVFEAQGIPVDLPDRNYNSTTILMVTAVRKSGTTSARPSLPVVTAGDFYLGEFPTGMTHFSTGERYEGMRVELRNVSVHTINDSASGRFEVIDGAGNTVGVSDYYPLYTLGPRRDPASTWTLPPVGGVIDTLRGVVRADGSRYVIAPMAAGDVRFGTPHKGAIRGTVWEDRNGNGIRDAGDHGSPGWAITVAGKAASVLASGPDGTYELPRIDSGTYRITITPRTNWSITPSTTVTVTLAADDTAQADFKAVFPWNTISGRIFRDWNEDGAMEGDAPGMAGWAVRLTGSASDSAVADSGGYYSLTGVYPGMTTVAAALPPGWELTTPILGPAYFQDIQTYGAHYANWNFGVRRTPQRKTFSVTAADNTPDGHRTITAGIRPGTTYGIWGVDPTAGYFDYSEVEFELPPRIGGLFDLRFEDPLGGRSHFGYGSWTDMRDFREAHQVDSFRIAFQPAYIYGGNFPMTVTWNPSEVAGAFSGPVTMTPVEGPSIDMKAASSYIAQTSSDWYVVVHAQSPNLPASLLRTWQLISLAEPVYDGRVPALFPSAGKHAYSYTPGPGYRLCDTLFCGGGYWMRYSPLLDTIRYVGPQRYADTVAVAAGWNIVGSLSVPSTSARTEPPGILTGSWFEYDDGGYRIADTVMPGKGYWVKPAAAGNLILNAGTEKIAAISADWRKKAYSLASEGGGTLYVITDTAGAPPASSLDMPPVPPEGLPDVRFASGQFAVVAPRGGSYRLAVSGSAAGLRWVPPAQSGGFEYDAWIENAGGRIALGGGRAVVVQPGDAARLVVELRAPLPTSFALGQNYPNPFNPTTSIGYDVPSAARVRIAVYDLLGREVRVLVDEERGAGRFSATWDGRNGAGMEAAGGVYFCTMRAAPSEGASQTFVRKMLLIR